ncbi:MAG: FecR domain-containing protein [Acidobacteria bacterium]|nr:FecR domain-containing protein [Acidobacteriota bacterium]
MFARHIGKELSAYAHGELPAAESARVARHLASCARCSAEFEEIKLGIRLVESLPPRAAPAALWGEIEAALAALAATNANSPTGFETETFAPVAPRPRDSRPEARARVRELVFGRGGATRLAGWRRAALACSLFILVAGVCGVVWVYRGSTRASWEVASLAGSPQVGSARVGKTGRLGVGEWLVTDADSRAQLSVANIGQVEIDPGTRLRLVSTKLTEHRIELAHGRMHARIWAPPRLFFVETPSAVAADLGCAYTLEVDDKGRSLLHVTSGWVAFETKDRESMVPAGASCVTQPGTGPGTPFFEDAGETFVESLARFDFARGGREALASVLREARARDTLTLWHLLARTSGEDRVSVYERLARLSPPPSTVTREGALALDRRMLDEWKGSLEATWLGGRDNNIKGTWRRLQAWMERNCPIP